MLCVKKVENNIISYSCSCGIEGKCLVKSMTSDGPFVINIRCPLCLSITQVCLGENNISEGHTSWGYVVENKITKYDFKDE